VEGADKGEEGVDEGGGNGTAVERSEEGVREEIGGW
jgi:hypothetical protein